MTSTLKDELFNELLESVREGGAILQGKTAPSRIFVNIKSESSHGNKLPRYYGLSLQDIKESHRDGT